MVEYKLLARHANNNGLLSWNSTQTAMGGVYNFFWSWAVWLGQHNENETIPNMNRGLLFAKIIVTSNTSPDSIFPFPY